MSHALSDKRIRNHRLNAQSYYSFLSAKELKTHYMGKERARREVLMTQAEKAVNDWKVISFVLSLSLSLYHIAAL